MINSSRLVKHNSNSCSKRSIGFRCALCCQQICWLHCREARWDQSAGSEVVLCTVTGELSASAVLWVSNVCTHTHTGTHTAASVPGWVEKMTKHNAISQTAFSLAALCFVLFFWRLCLQLSFVVPPYCFSVVCFALFSWEQFHLQIKK